MTFVKNIVVGKKFKDLQYPNENIYNLIPRLAEKRKHSPRYQSKYHEQTLSLYESSKKSHQTMGFAKTPLREPTEYLKKHCGGLMQKKSCNFCNSGQPLRCLNNEERKPPVPRRAEACRSAQPESSTKNFIKMNILNVTRKPPHRPPPKMADSKKGHTFLLEFSGLVPKFTRKKDFGECPKYLVQRKMDLEHSNELRRKTQSENKLIKLSGEERGDLLEGLRSNWEALNRKYLSLPLLIDTKTLKARKLDLEKRLGLLERDINFLEKNEDNDIFILPD